MECSRFVLLDECPGNAESWFLARCFDRLLAEGVHGVVSFADPVPRRTASGLLVMPGHVGTIYAATNAVYTGRATARTVKLLPDGTVFHDRTAQKIRRQEPRVRHGSAHRARRTAAPARVRPGALAEQGPGGGGRPQRPPPRCSSLGLPARPVPPRAGRRQPRRPLAQALPQAPRPRAHGGVSSSPTPMPASSSHSPGVPMPSRPATPTTPDLTLYDLLAPQLSGGKDSAVMMVVFMDAARAAGVDDRVISYHSSLGVCWSGRRSSSTASATRGCPSSPHCRAPLSGCRPTGTSRSPARCGPGRHTDAAQLARRDRGLRAVPPHGQPVLPQGRQGGRGLQRLDADGQPPKPRVRPAGSDPEGPGPA
ncbi:Mom family adenine methylcarbamoylation protein [Streptomyces albogriseolus]